MKIGDIVEFGYYQWQILDIQNERALIITKDIIELQAFHDKPGEITWSNSALRKYLNEPFYNTFSSEDKSKIITVTNTNEDNQWYKTDGGNDTQDRIFLLSIEEVVCQYFGDSSSLLYHPGKNQKYWFQRNDKNNSLRKARYDGSIWWWWLRSPGRNNKKFVYVHGDGNIGIQGNSIYKYNSNTIHPSTGDNQGGVRPALWLCISNDI